MKYNNYVWMLCFSSYLQMQYLLSVRQLQNIVGRKYENFVQFYCA